MPWMRKPLMLVATLVIVAAACAGGTAGDTPSSTSIASSPATSTTAPTPSSTSSTTVSDGDAPAPDGPTAPDFTLALADGGTFVLSQEPKPVYLIFWAEW